MKRRYQVREDLDGEIVVFDTNTGFYRNFTKLDFYDGTVRGGGCEYAARLPAYVFKKVYAIIDGKTSADQRHIFH